MDSGGSSEGRFECTDRMNYTAVASPTKFELIAEKIRAKQSAMQTEIFDLKEKLRKSEETRDRLHGNLLDSQMQLEQLSFRYETEIKNRDMIKAQVTSTRTVAKLLENQCNAVTVALQQCIADKNILTEKFEENARVVHELAQQYEGVQERYKEQLAEQTKSFKELRDQDYQQRLDERARMESQFQSRVDDLLHQLSKEKETLSALKVQLDCAHKRIEDLTNSTAVEQEKLMEELNKLKIKNTELKDFLLQQEASISNLEGVVAQKEQAVCLVQNRVQELEQDNLSQKENLDKVIKDFSSLQIVSEELKTQLRASEDSRQEIHDELVNVQESVVSVRAEFAKLASEKDALVEQLQQQKESLELELRSELQNTTDIFTKDLNVCRQQKQELIMLFEKKEEDFIARLHVFETKEKELKSLLDEKNSELNSCQSSLQSANSAVEELERQNLSLAANVKEMNIRTLEERKEAEMLQLKFDADFACNLKIIEEKEEIVKNLEEKVNALSVELQIAQESLASKEVEKQDLIRFYEDRLKTLSEEEKNIILELESKHKEAVAEKETLKQDLKEKYIQSVELQNKTEELKRLLDMAEAVNQKVKEENEITKREIEKIRNQIEEVGTEKERKEKETEKIKNEMEKIKNEMEKTKNENKQQNAKLVAVEQSKVEVVVEYEKRMEVLSNKVLQLQHNSEADAQRAHTMDELYQKQQELLKTFTDLQEKSEKTVTDLEAEFTLLKRKYNKVKGAYAQLCQKQKRAASENIAIKNEQCSPSQFKMPLPVSSPSPSRPPLQSILRTTNTTTHQNLTPKKRKRSDSEDSPSTSTAFGLNSTSSRVTSIKSKDEESDESSSSDLTLTQEEIDYLQSNPSAGPAFAQRKLMEREQKRAKKIKREVEEN